MFEIAYNLGFGHSIIGDDLPSVDELQPHEVIDMIIKIYNGESIEFYNINDTLVKLGDTVSILWIADDSGNAVDIFGVEPQLNGWVRLAYIEEITGVVEFDNELLMVVVKTKHRTYPLSQKLRYNSNVEKFELLDAEDLEEAKDEFELSEVTVESITNYIKINSKNV